MFDGQIWAAPEPKGTSRTETAPDRSPCGSTERKRILVIEDDAIVSLAMEHLLAEAGYVIVATCARGEDALEQAERHRPDLVLADVKLSGAMDGIDAVVAIRARLDVPAIFVTAHTDPATLARMQATRPAEILAKPVPDLLLVRVVGAALGS